MSLSFLSFDEKSNPDEVPGVLGVFDWPNDANAPVPKPKADEPIPGDLAEAGVVLLKGFDLP